jgi:cyclophilin family peptidyl-prolyl cis-trans isomerase
VLYEAEDIIAYTAKDEASQQAAMVWHTSLGDKVRVQLLPDLAPGSVRELRRAVALLTAAVSPSQQHHVGFCSNCRIYRAEKGFLVQGVLEAPGAYVGIPRRPNPPQKMVMERGLVCWAGGGGGPHWFVNIIDNGGFKDDHLCFGKVSEPDMVVFDRILQLPLKKKEKPEDMNILQTDITFNVSFGADGLR